MEDVCRLCGQPFSEENPLWCRGLHHRCYHVIYRFRRREQLKQRRIIRGWLELKDSGEFLHEGVR